MASRPPQQQRQELKLKANYLVAYNTLSSALWAVVLVRTAVTVARGGFENVYDNVGEYTKWTQTLAVMEIIHALAGRCQFTILAPFTLPKKIPLKSNL